MFLLYTKLVSGGWWLVKYDDNKKVLINHCNTHLSTNAYIILEDSENDLKIIASYPRLIETEESMHQLCDEHTLILENII